MYFSMCVCGGFSALHRHIITNLSSSTYVPLHRLRIYVCTNGGVSCSMHMGALIFCVCVCEQVTGLSVNHPKASQGLAFAPSDLDFDSGKQCVSD